MRTIEIKGVGSAKVPVDYVNLELNLDSIDMEYEKAMDLASEGVQELKAAFTDIGFSETALKTKDFGITKLYKYEKDADGEARRVFTGFGITHKLHLEFDFNQVLLGQVLTAISKCSVTPEVNIDFTVKSKQMVKAELLRSATENAREKAEILCAAAGVRLGKLLNISYSWGEINVSSATKHNTRFGDIPSFLTKSVDIEPEDVKASDTVNFVWEIE